MGYIQGMNYLAGMHILRLSISLAMICIYIPSIYLSFQCLTNLLASEHIYAFFNDQACSHSLFLSF